MILWPLYRTTWAISFPQLRNGGFCSSSFTAHMPLLMATSTSGLGRVRVPQLMVLPVPFLIPSLHRLCTHRLSSCYLPGLFLQSYTSSGCERYYRIAQVAFHTGQVPCLLPTSMQWFTGNEKKILSRVSKQMSTYTPQLRRKPATYAINDMLVMGKQQFQILSQLARQLTCTDCQQVADCWTETVSTSTK